MSVDIIGLTSTTQTGWKNTLVSPATRSKCPFTATVTLAGSTGSAWATAAIKKISTAILTDSDGYKITLAVGRKSGVVYATGFVEGGCLLHATSNHVCFRAPARTATVALIGMKATWIKKADYKIGALVAGTAITAAKWGLVYVPVCDVANATTPVAACGSFGKTVDTDNTYGGSWYQPKETAKKVYTELARFSAKETGAWVAIGDTTALSTVATACGSGKALKGASALVAGAAVAFGAAALAF
jgi:hypothetical protein